MPGVQPSVRSQTVCWVTQQPVQLLTEQQQQLPIELALLCLENISPIEVLIFIIKYLVI